MKGRGKLRRSAAILSTLLAVGMAGVGCGGSNADSSDSSDSGQEVPVVDLKVMFAYAVNGNAAGIVAGIERGTFREHGINVDIQLPANNSTPIRTLATNGTDLVFISSTELMIGRAEGIQAKLIATVLQENGSGILTSSDSGIDLQNLKTLEGRNIGITGQAAARLMLEDRLRSNGVDLDKVTFTTIGFNGIQALASKQIDAHGDTVIWRPAAYNQAIGRPLDDTSTYQFRTYEDMGGVRAARTALAATEEWLAKNGDVARRFVAALQESLAWAIDHPRETAELTVKRFPELNVDQVEVEWKSVIPLLNDEETLKHGLCWHSPEKFDKAAAFLAEKGIIARKVTAEEALTNEYVPTKK